MSLLDGIVIHANVHLASESQVAEIQQSLHAIVRDLHALQLQGVAMSEQIDRLSSDVSQNTTVIGSAVTLLGNLSAQIRSLQNDPAALAKLADDLEANSNALAQAVAENTPAAPAEPV